MENKCSYPTHALWRRRRRTGVRDCFRHEPNYIVFHLRRIQLKTDSSATAQTEEEEQSSCDGDDDVRRD